MLEVLPQLNTLESYLPYLVGSPMGYCMTQASNRVPNTVNPQMRLAGLILLSRLQMRVLLEFGPFCLLFFNLNAGVIRIRVLLEGKSYLRIYGI